ncbi:hypothetical protein [Desulfallas thermosapovorans]|uniref:Uncharacterized protein n=1 Tax=Desulfallas thermosapovorans DSM 6562 TaxID=1121431 RepID=A0A5S4ZQD5_9FIRM|nr:hypothetical protein [Desulfallas thermosapovorans]TYO95004.1 hypothetical protein LX24_02025 [Desulfallas thermosapovorans DSM 6562]
MPKRVAGILAKNTTGYRPVWDMGRAAGVKKRQRITGINRPST